MSKSIFLFLFLLPNLIFALGQTDCLLIFNRIQMEWKNAEQKIANFRAASTTTDALSLLQNAINSCQAALADCNMILSDLARHSKSKKEWRSYMKSQCEEKKKQILARIEELNTALQHLLGVIEQQQMQEKMAMLFQKIVQKGNEGKEILESFSPTQTDQEKISQIRAGQDFYKQASFLVEELLMYPLSQQDRDTIQKMHEAYQQNLLICETALQALEANSNF